MPLAPLLLLLVIFLVLSVQKVYSVFVLQDRPCGLVVRVPGYRQRGPGFNSRRCEIF
jgi:hypothetical protein